MKKPHIIGADLSKRSIDLLCHQTQSHLKIENTRSGFHQMMKWVKKQKINTSSILVVMEHTGFCSYQFEQLLHAQAIRYTKVPALAIKRSLGMVRGKSDKMDARRIALYGFEKQDKLACCQPADKNLERLQMLHATRARLVKQRSGLFCALKEYKQIGIKSTDLIMQSQTSLIKGFDRQIQKLEEAIQAIVESDKALANNFSLLTSIKGVGKIVAISTIIKTQNFIRFANARKFACFCGTAPFEHTSGTSIRGKTKVSHLADKEMKVLLDLAAKCAIQHDKELRAYYLKRIEKGKSKMSTINIVRNKILYRMFAVIKRQTPYVEEYLTAA
jgi:transposase